MAAAEAMYAGTREECLKLANELAKRYSISLEAVYRAMILLDFSLVAGMPYSLVYIPAYPSFLLDPCRPTTSSSSSCLYMFITFHLHLSSSSASSSVPLLLLLLLLFLFIIFFFFGSTSSLPYSLLRDPHSCRHPCF